MNKFVIKFTLWSIGLTVIVALLSMVIDPFIYKGYEGNLPELAKKQPETLLMGDSHAWALGQEFLGEKTYNFAYDSDSFFDIYCKLIYCVDHQIPLRTILLECDRHMFSEYRLRTNSEKRTVRLVTRIVYQDAYSTDLGDYLLNRFVYRTLSALDINNSPLLIGLVKDRVKGWFSPDETDSLTWAMRSEDERSANALARLNFQLNQPYTAQLEVAFHKILALCKKNGIEVIGVRFPLSVEYRQLLVNQDLSQVEQIYEASGIPIIDLSDRITDANYFKDEDHLNQAGADRFCELLLGELDSLQNRR